MTIGRVNLEGSSLVEMLDKQVKRTSIEIARVEALQADLSKANLEKATAQSKLFAIQAKLIELMMRAEQAEI